MKIYDNGIQNVSLAKALIDRDLAVFVQTWRASYDYGSTDAIDAYCQILLRGGKRLRGILAMQSYYAHGGIDETVALGAARVLELVQAYLLVVDDIADKSDTRRNGPSAHRLIEQTARGAGQYGDIQRYSEMQAINAAQCAMHRAAQELLALPISDMVARAALQSIHANIEITARGQMNDLFNSTTNQLLDESAIERVLTQKSAYYTLVNPLELGACLAGRTQLDDDLRTYGLHTGCAFQITDDMIGTFGEANETGKSINDDIREGKMTLIAQYALAQADESQRSILRHTLGNSKATDSECDEVRGILRATHADEYATKRTQQYVEQAHETLASTQGEDPNFIQFLHMLTDYVAARQS